MRARFSNKSTVLRCLLLVIAALLTASMCEAGTDRAYVVKKGDNLNKISREFGVSVKDIRHANNLSSIALRTGARLKIPAKGKGPKLTKHASEPAATKAFAHGTAHIPSNAGRAETVASKPEVLYHTVRKGETLASIAKEYSLSPKELAEFNNIKKKSAKLRPGRKLIVGEAGPKTYTVKKGETIWRIADRFDMAAEDLMKINGLESHEVKTGQKLLLEMPLQEPDTADPVAMSSAAEISNGIKTLEASQELGTLTVKQRLILFSKKMLDIPYRFGGSSFVGIDCSGYVQKVFGLLDVTLPRTAREQFHLGETVSKESLSVGDLVFFRTYASFPSHVGIYLGNNLFIHASSKNRKVSIDSLDTPYYFRRFIGAKRLFNDELKESLDKGDSG